MQTLTPRLGAVAQMVQNTETLIDIGTDHGYLPIYLLQTGKISYATCADVRMGPLAKAKENIDITGVNARTLLSDGFNCVTRLHDVATICGMGGETMCQILKNGGDKVPETLVLQPMTGCEDIRKYLFENGYEITDESFVTEGKRVYCIIKAVHTGNNTDYTYPDLFLGKIRPHTKEFSVWAEKNRLQAEKRLLADECNQNETQLIKVCKEVV